MKRLGVLACVAALMLLAAACGPRVAPDGMVGVGEVASPGAVSTDVAVAPTDPSATEAVAGAGTPAPGTAASPGAPAASPSPRPSPNMGAKHNNGVVRIELSATCVTPGSLLTVTLRTPPKAGLGMIIGYSDNQAHGAMLTGESDANGVYVWRVVVEPTVPDGEAKVLVSATGPNWSQEGGGSADKPFRVARGGC